MSGEDVTATVDPALVEDLRSRAVIETVGGDELPGERDLREAVRRLLDADRTILPRSETDAVEQAVVDAALGLGPLEPLLRDPAITEVMVSRPDRVFVERDGRIRPTRVRFHDDAHLLHVIDRILAPLSRRVDEASPMVDARLPDGSRVNVVIPPLAVDGPALTIRRFGERRIHADDLVDLGTIDRRGLDLLRAAVEDRRNILVTGGTGTGKTTTLAAIAGFIPDDQRVVTIEDAAELALGRNHVVRLESRPPSLEGRGAVGIRALVRNALRMRPDRIIVGEVRGGEALDMLTALTTGHAGSLSTVHASSPDEALRRLVTLALMGDLDLPHGAVAEQVAGAIDLIVHQVRAPDGSRRISCIAEVGGGATGLSSRWIARCGATGFEHRGAR